MVISHSSADLASVLGDCERGYSHHVWPGADDAVKGDHHLGTQGRRDIGTKGRGKSEVRKPKSEIRDPKAETSPNSLKWVSRKGGDAAFRRGLRTTFTIAVQIMGPLTTDLSRHDYGTAGLGDYRTTGLGLACRCPRRLGIATRSFPYSRQGLYGQVAANFDQKLSECQPLRVVKFQDPTRDFACLR